MRDRLGIKAIYLAAGVLLALALAGCGGAAQPTVEVDEGAAAPQEPVEEAVEELVEEAAEEPATEEPAAQPTAETAVEEEADEGPSFTFEGLNQEQFDSFVSDVALTFDGVDEDGQTINMNVTGTMHVQRDPVLMAFEYETAEFGGAAVSGLPLDLEGGQLRFYVTADRAYTSVGGMCIAFPIDESEMALDESFGDIMLDPEDLTRPGSELPEMQFVGTETLDGQQVEHYRAENATLENIEQATIDVWVASGANYVARMEISGVTTDAQEAYGEGTLNMTYEVTSVNEPLEVAPPENCQEFTIPEMPGG